MPAMTLYEELENVLTNRLKGALRTGEIIDAPDWVCASRRPLRLVPFPQYGPSLPT